MYPGVKPEESSTTPAARNDTTVAGLLAGLGASQEALRALKGHIYGTWQDVPNDVWPAVFAHMSWAELFPLGLVSAQLGALVKTYLPQGSEPGGYQVDTPDRLRLILGSRPLGVTVGRVNLRSVSPDASQQELLQQWLAHKVTVSVSDGATLARVTTGKVETYHGGTTRGVTGGKVEAYDFAQVTDVSGGEVDAFDSAQVTDVSGGVVNAMGTAQVTGISGGEVRASGTAQVTTTAGGLVEARGAARVTGVVGGEVRARGTARIIDVTGGWVYAHDFAQVTGVTGGWVYAYDSTKVSGVTGGVIHAHNDVVVNIEDGAVHVYSPRVVINATRARIYLHTRELPKVTSMCEVDFFDAHGNPISPVNARA